MNKILNQGGTSAGGTGCAVTSWNRHSIRLALPEVANDVDAGRGSQCSPTNGHQEVDEVVVRSRRDVGEVVVQGASSRIKTLPKNLIARVPCRTFSKQRFRRPALARAVRAALAMGMQKAAYGEGRGLLSRST